MNTAFYKRTELILLASGAAISLLAILFALDWALAWPWHVIWVISPYAVFALFRGCTATSLKPDLVAGCICSGAMVGFAVLLYGYCLIWEASSTSALVFLFTPLYTLVGWPVVYSLAFLIVRRGDRREVAPNTPGEPT